MSEHHIVHVEIAATDPKVAGKFYADLFGWKVETVQPQDYQYFETGEGHPSGGFPQATGEMYNPGDVLVYVSTDDVDATLAKGKALGGTVLAPTFEIPTIGWMGILADPAGNKIALFKGMAPGE